MRVGLVTQWYDPEPGPAALPAVLVRGLRGQNPTTSWSQLVSDDSMLGATVAITGGTGSFGSTMVKHLLARGVNKVHILSRDEAKQDDMRRRFSDSRLRLLPGRCA